MMLGHKAAPTPIPGSATLLFSYARNGTQTAGYYGRVAATDLITGPALSTLVGLTSGVAINSSAGWLKFLCDGKTLFIAQMSFKNQLSWTQAQASIKTVQIGGHTYKCRLINGIIVGSANTIVGTEWNRLIYSVTTATTVAECEITGSTKWDSFTYTDMGIVPSGGGGATLCTEYYHDAQPPTNTQGTFRGGGTAPNPVDYVGGTLLASSGSAFGWRPVLELVS